MNMKTKQSRLRRLWNWINDPRQEKPLMIIAIWLALILAGLLLWPVLRSDPGSETDAGTRALQSEAAGPVSEPEPEEEASGEIPAVVTIAEAPEEQATGWRQIDGKTYYLDENGTCAVGLRKIDGKLHYFNQNGVKASSLGIDVSYYDNSIDWKAVKAAGIDFAIVRVGGRGWGSGKLYGDCRMEQYLQEAKDAGIPLGVYFYSTAVHPGEAVEEAAATLQALNGFPLDLPVFLDLEFSGEYPTGRADQLSPSQRAAIAAAFCETIRNGGYRPGVYAGQNFLKASLDYFSVSRYTIWLASYTADNRLPAFQKPYDIWQFTDQGRVDGIGGYVDMNVIFS